MSSSILSFNGKVVGFALWMAAVLTGANITMAHLAERYDASEPKVAQLMTMQDQPLDLLVLGNSLVLNGVDAAWLHQHTGINAYNFALGGSSMVESEMLLRHFLRHNPAPRTVALGLYLNYGGGPNTVRPSVYSALPRDLQALCREHLLRFDNQHLEPSLPIFNALPAYRYRSSLIAFFKALGSPQDRTPTFVRGQARLNYVATARGDAPHDAGISLPALISFLETCQAAQVDVLLFEPPNHPAYTQASRGRAEVLARVQALAEHTPRTQFVSYVDLPMDDAHDWLGLNHLNRHGAEKFTAQLAARLQALAYDD